MLHDRGEVRRRPRADPLPGPDRTEPTPPAGSCAPPAPERSLFVRSFIDLHVSDRATSPPDHARFYSERLALMPHSYLVSPPPFVLSGHAASLTPY